MYGCMQMVFGVGVERAREIDGGSSGHVQWPSQIDRRFAVCCCPPHASPAQPSPALALWGGWSQGYQAP